MALGGIDLSWLAGFGVGGGIYYFLHRSRRTEIVRSSVMAK
jgi:hypothetical protein